MPLKVLLVINSLGTGGAERSLAELLPYLRQAGIGVTVACLRHPKESAHGVHKAVEAHGVGVEVLPAAGFAGRALALRRVIRREAPDLVHTSLYMADQLGRLAALGTGVPVMSSLVNVSYGSTRSRLDPNLSPWKMGLVQAADAVTARLLTARFHAITKTAKAHAVEQLGIAPERVTVVERGRSRARFGEPTPERRQRARQALGLADEDEVVLSVGRHYFQKGQRYLLEAGRLVARRRPRLRLLLAGIEGPMTPELEALAEEAPLRGGRVRFLGYREDVPDLLCAADVFAFPSLFEGLGGAMIEAMAMGVPVVASDIAPLREVSEGGSGALLVEPRSAGALAEGVERLLGDRAGALALGGRGREIFERRFRLEQVAERMVALYYDVARGGETASRSVSSDAAFAQLPSKDVPRSVTS